MQKFRQLARRGIRYIRRLPLPKQVILVLFFAGSFLAAGFAILIFLVSKGFFGPLPEDSELKSIRHPAAAEVYSADTVLLGKYYIQDRSSIPFEQISPAVVEALVATEDIRF